MDNPVSQLDFYNTGMFVGQTDGEIYALNVATGKAFFRYQTAARGFAAFHIENGILIAQAEDSLYGFKLPKQLLEPLPASGKADGDLKTDIKILFNGKPQASKLNPVMIQNQLYVSLQAAAEAVGAKVQENGASGDATIIYNNRNFSAP